MTRPPDAGLSRAPSGLRGPTGTGHELALDRYIGTVAIVMCFLDDVTDPVSVEVAQAVNDHLVDFGEEVVQAVLVATSPSTAVRAVASEHGWRAPLVADPAGEWRRAFAVPDGEASITADRGRVRAQHVVVVDRAGVVVRTLRLSTGGALADELLQLTTELGIARS